jgi:hypothetical protein
MFKKFWVILMRVRGTTPNKASTSGEHAGHTGQIYVVQMPESSSPR